MNKQYHKLRLKKARQPKLSGFLVLRMSNYLSIEKALKFEFKSLLKIKTIYNNQLKLIEFIHLPR